MAISTILISSDSSEESVRTSSVRVLWFAPDYIPASLNYSPASDTKPDPSEDPSSDHIPQLPVTLPFISSTDDSSESGTPDTPPLPTHEIPPVEVAPPTSQILPAPFCVRHRRLCSSVSSIPRSSTAITKRPSHTSPAGPSCKRSRSPTTSVLLSLPIPGALSSIRADLLLPHKRIRSPKTVTNLKDCSDESSKSSAEINECIAYVDALRAEGKDAKVVVETVAQEEVKSSARGTIVVSDDRVTHLVVPDDIPKPAQEEGAVKVTYETLGDLVTIPTTRSGATMTREAVNELIACQVAEALEARDASRNLEPLVEGGGEQEDKNGDDYEGGNGGGNGYKGVNRNGGNRNRGNRTRGNRNGGVSGNGNGGGNGNGNDNGNGNGNRRGNGFNFGGFMPVAQECTYQEFLKCQPLNFNGTKGVIGLTCWFEKMETVFHISNCPQKYQVKMVPDEEDRVERFIRGLLDNIQGNVIAAEPTGLQDAIRIANNLMD
ncbi:hypothetical protein Tco_0280394 [Tanacetum coccineum]